MKTPDCVDKLRDRFKELQHTRTLALRHDYATLLGLGVVMHVVYDQAVFYTFNRLLRVLSPSIHMICVSSFSLEDQTAFLQDRLNYLYSCDIESKLTMCSIAYLIVYENCLFLNEY
jgi:hypothetical protein